MIIKILFCVLVFLIVMCAILLLRNTEKVTKDYNDNGYDELRNKKIKTFDYIQYKIEKEVDPVIKEMKKNGKIYETNDILTNIHMSYRSKIADCKTLESVNKLTNEFDEYIKSLQESVNK